MRRYKTALDAVKLHKWYIVLFAMFVLSFNFNIFGLGQTSDWFSSFQNTSSYIVEKTVECKGVISNYSGPVNAPRSTMRNDGCPNDKFVPYVSQFGLQARTLVAFSDMFSSNERAFKVVQIVLTIVFSATLTVLVRKFSQELGDVPAIVVASGLLLSPWLAGFSYNLYWVVFTLFLPFVFSFCAYEYFKNSKHLLVFYVILLLLFFVKFLNGYEYASTMVLSAFIPVVFFEVKDVSFRRLLRTWKQACAVLGVGLVALALAIFVNVAGAKGYYGSLGTAFEAVVGRAEERSNATMFQAKVISSLEGTANPIYGLIDRIYDLDKLKDGDGEPYKYAVLSTVNYTMLPAVSLPVVFKEPFGTIVQSILATAVVTQAMFWHLKSRKYQVEVLGRLQLMFWLGLIGAASWSLLMPGHSYVHPHMNAIVFYVPFLITCYGIFGLYAKYYLSRRK